jgi:hypothetical protein
MVGDLVPAALVIMIIAITGVALWRDSSDTYDTEQVYLVSAFVGTIGWMLLEFPRLGENGLAAVTAGWAILGLAAVMVAKMSGSRSVLGLGFITLGIAMAKLFLVDLAEASPIARISLFAGIGVALLAVGYWLGDNGVDVDRTVIEPPDRDGETEAVSEIEAAAELTTADGQES